MSSQDDTANQMTNDVADAEKNAVATGAITDAVQTEIGELLLGSELHPLEMNVWDAAFLVGTRIYLPQEIYPIYITAWQAVNIVFLFCVNFTMQLGFVIACWIAYKDGSWISTSDIFEAILHQRFFTHHEYARVNWVEQQTEIRMLCEGLHVSQLGMLAEETNRYIGKSPAFSGKSFAMLACLIWTVSMWVEIRQSICTYVAMAMMESDHATADQDEISVGQVVEALYQDEWSKAEVKAFPDDDPEGTAHWTVQRETDPPGTLTYALEIRRLSGERVAARHSISDKRKKKKQIHLGGIKLTMVKDMSRRHKVLLLCLVTVPRLVIGILLYLVGIIFLADTIEVGEIILNCCALEIVKNIDEILFEALSSRGLQKVVDRSVLKSRDINVKTLGWRRWYWTGWMFQCFVIGILMMMVYYSSLESFFRDVEEAEANICKNDLDFAFIDHPMSGLPVFVNVKDNDGDEPSVGNKSLVMAGSPQDSLKCYYHAKVRLFKLKYHEDDTSFLASLVKSTAKDCDHGGHRQKECGTKSLVDMRSLAMLTHDEIRNSEAFCKNQDTQLDVVRQSCTDGEFQASHSMKDLFLRKTNCQDWTEICICPTLTATCDEYEFERCNITAKYGIESYWIEVIRGLCPCSCGMCTHPCQEYGMGDPVNFSYNFQENLKQHWDPSGCHSALLTDPRVTPAPTPAQPSQPGNTPNQTSANQGSDDSMPLGGGRRLASLPEAGVAKSQAAGQVQVVAHEELVRRVQHLEAEKAALARQVAELEKRELMRLTAENEALAQRVTELEQRPTRSEFEELRQNLESIQQLVKNVAPSQSPIR